MGTVLSSARLFRSLIECWFNDRRNGRIPSSDSGIQPYNPEALGPLLLRSGRERSTIGKHGDRAPWLQQRAVFDLCGVVNGSAGVAPPANPRRVSSDSASPSHGAGPGGRVPKSKNRKTNPLFCTPALVS